MVLWPPIFLEGNIFRYTGQLIFSRIIETVATSCQLNFKAKCFTFDFGSHPAVGAYSAAPDPLAGFKGAPRKSPVAKFRSRTWNRVVGAGCWAEPIACRVKRRYIANLKLKKWLNKRIAYTSKETNILVSELMCSRSDATVLTKLLVDRGTMCTVTSISNPRQARYHGRSSTVTAKLTIEQTIPV